MATAPSARPARGWLAPHDNGSGPRPAAGFAHLFLGNLAMLGLVRGKEVIQGPQPSFVVGLQSQRVVHPGAHALRLSLGDGFLGDGHQFGVH